MTQSHFVISIRRGNGDLSKHYGASVTRFVSRRCAVASLSEFPDWCDVIADKSGAERPSGAADAASRDRTRHSSAQRQVVRAMSEKDVSHGSRAVRMAPERPAQTQLSSVHYNAAPPVRPVSLRRCLHDQRRDPVSGLALGPASAQLCFLLPIYDLELNGPRNSSDLQKGLDARLPPGGKYACHVTGSSIERLSVPPYTERDGGEQPAQYRVADVDVMLEIRPLSVALRPGDGAAIYMDASRSSHRGYTRVVAEPAAAQANPIFCRPVGDDGGPEIYLSIDTVNDALTALTTLFIPTATVHRQGPSVNVQQPGDIHHHGPLAYINDMDVVPALPLTERPPEFTDWLKRVRGRQWPPEELQQEMERDGRCFLVGAGHASSSRRDLEWRLSFSEPERRLALSLTPQQRKVYVLIKMMQKCYLQEPKVLVTYHIKTLMFWELEECSNTDWVEEELFERVLAMLDRIEACLEQQYIPSYFMPDNNLISHADAGDVATVLATVRQIRRQPLQHLYGIDDRFRFDFSSPRPLSELHEPLRRLLLNGGGGGEEAAEALTVSLIEQAQADVRRGLGEQRRCARLLQSAWEALAAAAPEGAPHPVHDDWLMFAAAAAFEAMGADESVWALQALEAVFDDRDRPGTFTQVPVEAAQALRQSLLPQSGDDTETKSTGEYQLKLNEIVRSGLLEKPSPVSTVIHLRLAQLELLRDLKHKQLENIPDMPPLMASAIKTQIELSNIDMTFKFKLSCGVPEHEALADLMQKLMAVTVGLLRDDEKRSVSTSVHSLATKTARELLRSEDMPDSVEDALRNDGDLAEQCQKLDERLKPAEKNPSRLPFDTDPRMLNYIPMHMTHLYQLAFTGGLSESELDHYYTPFFNMMGFFLKQKRLQYAFRTVGMLTCIWTTAPEWELHRVVYNVNRAPLYLQQLPEPARALLLLTSGRTTIGVLYRFIDLMHRTFVFEGVRIDDLLTGQLPHQQLEKMEATIVQTAPLVDDDVELTHLVMRLCVLKVLGRDTDGGLADILAVSEDGVVETIGEILREWRVGEQPPKTATPGSKAARLSPEAAPSVTEEVPTVTGEAAPPATEAGFPSTTEGEAPPVDEEMSRTTDRAAPTTDEVVPTTGAAGPTTEKALPASKTAAPATRVAAPTTGASVPPTDATAIGAEKAAPASETAAPIIERTSAAEAGARGIQAARSAESAEAVTETKTGAVNESGGAEAANTQKNRKRGKRSRCVIS